MYRPIFAFGVYSICNTLHLIHILKTLFFAAYGRGRRSHVPITGTPLHDFSDQVKILVRQNDVDFEENKVENHIS